MRRWDSGSKGELPGLETTTEIRVRYGETDAMGWVYYGVYLVYFEVGRTELIRSVWRSYCDLEKEGMRLPVVETGCRYLYGARYDDLIAVASRMTLPSACRIRFDYRISRSADGKRLAVGYTEHCFVDLDGKPIRIPDELSRTVVK